MDEYWPVGRRGLLSWITPSGWVILKCRLSGRRVQTCRYDQRSIHYGYPIRFTAFIFSGRLSSLPFCHSYFLRTPNRYIVSFLLVFLFCQFSATTGVAIFAILINFSALRVLPFRQFYHVADFTILKNQVTHFISHNSLTVLRVAPNLRPYWFSHFTNFT